ncbi:MAG: Stk1 family PASTA domain-containing Ser/Thr kinase [Pseudolysinimonas sp.]|uniref:Stk1 family PASTA domain-containing Ser/Thr kinase n=1 Tax=Pseudolysinimonas sp. TaxID=2680009 RepID=UPI003263545B
MSVGTTDPMIGRLIDGRYQVRSRIARGGMATVYLATDLRLERRVAVKVMHGHLADDSAFKERFIQEARSAARLAHPNVVNVFDQGQDSESAYLVMEYLPGITLRELLEEYGTLTPQQTIDITEAVLNGLQAAHKAGIIHRDLKPENVLLADDGRIKIGDFGLARAASQNTATGAALLGTIAYLSPELVTRGVADTRSDIYAVGIMMYEMLTGEQPFTGEQPMQIAYRHANEPLPLPSAKNPRVPAELDEIVLWATAKDPEARPADVRVLLEQIHDTEALIDLASTGPQKPLTTRAFPNTRPPQRGTGAMTSVITPAITDAARPERPLANAETQVLGSRMPGAAGTALAVAEPAARRRQPRRWIPIVAILAVLLLALGTAWWFVFGPGARVTIPDSIRGATVEEATTTLTGLGLEVSSATGTAYSVTAPVGTVAESTPAIGEPVGKGVSVTLLISQGPEPFDVSALQAGMTEVAANDVVASHWTQKDTEYRFDAATGKGLLLDALDGDGKTLLGVAQYGDQQPITLVVSAGPVPPVAGLTVADATSALSAVKLSVDAGKAQQNYDDTVPEGSVIGIVDPGGPLRPNDSVGLNLSRGREPVTVPNIVGHTWTEAKQMLTDAGLRWTLERDIDTFLASKPDDSRVSRVTPDVGAPAFRGDTVSIRLTAG